MVTMTSSVSPLSPRKGPAPAGPHFTFGSCGASYPGTQPSKCEWLRRGRPL